MRTREDHMTLSLKQFAPLILKLPVVGEVGSSLEDKHDEKGIPQVQHNVNIEPALLSGDVGYTVFEISGTRLFRRLLERLAYLLWEPVTKVCARSMN